MIPGDVVAPGPGAQTCAVGEPPCAGTWFGIESTQATSPPVLQVLPQVRLGVDGPAGARTLTRDERADVDDPLTLLARDPGPVIGIGGVGQVLALGELVDDRVQQVLDA